MKRWTWITLIVIVAAQFVQPDRTPPVGDPTHDLIAMTMSRTITIRPESWELDRPLAEVEGILRSACYDCHSNQTRHPWYAYVTPVNWWIQKSHVEHARHHLNFSRWGAYSPEDRADLIEEAQELVGEGDMPLDSYAWLHGDARLTEDQRQQLVGFFAAPE